MAFPPDPLQVDFEDDVDEVVAATTNAAHTAINETVTELVAHEADTSVHGIADTTVLATDAEVAAAVAAHAAAGDPHPTYTTAAEAGALVTAHEGAANPHPTYETSAEAAAKVTAHEGAADPHPGYLTTAEGNAAYEATGAAAAAVSTHAGLSDPHAGYRLESVAITAADVAADVATQAELDAKVTDAIVDGVTTVAPSQNAVFDALALKANLAGGTFTGDISVPDEVYDATAWNGSVEVPTKNALRDKIESLGAGGSVATDAIFDAKGDLPTGTGANTSAKTVVGSDGSVLTANSNSSTGLIYAAPFRQKYQSASLVHSPDTMVNDGGSAGQSAALAQYAFWFPVWAYRRMTITELGDYCYTLEAGSGLRLGLYADGGSLVPTTLLADYGIASGATTGAKNQTGSQVVDPGWFHICAWLSNHTTVRWGRGSFRQDTPFPMSMANGRINFGWFTSAVDYSAGLPANAPAVALADNVTHVNAPFVGWKFT